MGFVAHMSGDEGCQCISCLNGGGDPEGVIERAKSVGPIGRDADLGSFVHLHCHSNLSFRDSINNIDDMVAFAALLGYKAIALTDHGHMFGAVRLAMACRDRGVAPIFGMEAYEAIPDDVESETEPPGYSPHLTLLVTSKTGWKNLVALHTKSYQFPYAYRSKSNNRIFPRIDRVLLEKHSEGLICMSACLGGKVAQAFDQNPNSDAEILKVMSWYRDVFGDRFYVELMANSPEQKAIIHHQRELCRKQKIKCVPTNDVHYLQHALGRKGGPHNVYSAARWGPRPLMDRWAEADGKADGENNQTGWYGSDEFFLKSPAEMIASGFSEAELQVSLEIADRCIGKFDPAEIKAPPPPAPIEKRPELERSIFDGWRNSDKRVLR